MTLTAKISLVVRRIPAEKLSLLLGFCKRANSRVHEENVVCHGKVKSHAPCLEADEQHLNLWVVLKGLQDLRRTTIDQEK